MDVGAWLRGLGLERYEQAFCDNDVDADVLPELTADDLTTAPAGIRAQALAADGTLVDDFLFVEQGTGAGSVLHVLNAPSPAATAALPIGREILEKLTGEKLAPL